MTAVIIALYFCIVANYAITSSTASSRNTIENIKSRRQEILRDEALLAIGGKVNLTNAEQNVNKCLMEYKFREIEYGFNNPEYLNFSHHYFLYKDKIKYSKVYQLIKKMPKGAALHVHDMALLGPDYLLNITYMDHLYVCLGRAEVKFLFANTTPPNTSCLLGWQLMIDARASSNNIRKFDAELRKKFTIVTDEPDKIFSDINKVWRVFSEYFITVVPLLTYRPVWEQYFYDALKAFRDDKIMYLEVRSVLPVLYDLDGTHYDEVVTARAYKKAVTKFKKRYPDFVGAKLIYAPLRLVGEKTVEKYIDIAKRIKKNLPDLFAGFDLVGQEDLGEPLLKFVPALTKASDELNYFFHAGETDWYGTMVDENLIDAIVLGAKRIGHGYALLKHPLVKKEVKEREIAIEVNVLSNTILSLVRDLRNHPLSAFLAEGMPVVLSSDDPGVWEADPLSHDYYVAFQGVASKHADLRLLKTLAINSLNYSALNETEKMQALSRFHKQWYEFIKNFIC